MSINLSEVLHEALPLVEKFAPTIGSILGGIPGLASGSALSLLSKAFDTNPSNIHKLGEAIVNDPDAADKLADLDNQHGTWLSYIENIKNLAKAEINIKLEWQPNT